MQDIEIRRYNAARAAFENFFTSGYAHGKERLLTGRSQRDTTIEGVFYVDVPIDDVLDGEWQAHVSRFFNAGILAATASRREGEAALDAFYADPDSREAQITDRLRWTVLLNPRSLRALPSAR